MALVLGLDLGTTTITALALDAGSGEVAGRVTVAHRAGLPSAPNRSEWDVAAIARTGCDCLKELARQLGPRADLAGLGITGQQHGVVLVDRDLRPLTNLVNWQDRRGEEPCPGTATSWVEAARQRLGDEAPARTGCRLSAGYMAVTLFWLAGHGQLPREGTACFLMDYAAALLTGTSPITDPTCAASAGVLDVARGDWADDLIAALVLPRSLFPPVRLSGERAGGLTPAMAEATGLPAGLPVFAGIGDNQASFLGSVADPDDTVLVNVGTGGQVAVWTPTYVFDPRLETRPFPGDGYLLVSAGLSGGSAYAQLERFFRAWEGALQGAPSERSFYDLLNRLAAEVPPGCDGLVCEPFFTGTRAEPARRAAWAGLSAENFTPGHLARSLLEGMARTFAGSGALIARLLGRAPGRLVGAGNAVRANPLLGRMIAEAFALPLRVPAHREEAAFGAALLAGVRAGFFPDLGAAGRLVRLEPL
jgi:sugar (pentulose or hexulose) kinase